MTIEMIPLLLASALWLGSDSSDRQTVIVVVGASGTEEYAAAFASWEGRWREAAQRASADYQVIGRESGTETSDYSRLQQLLAGAKSTATEPLWLVLIGHGTFDGRVAKFNLRGPDVSAEELASWLAECGRPLAVVNCASSSGPFINQLSGEGRVVVSATKNGFEQNYARFGDYLSQAILDPSADLDKDEQTSLLEAFLLAGSRVEEFYKSAGRLATEHALLDDNGDELGTPADWYRGVRTTKVAQDGASPDGPRANQLCLVRSDLERSLPAELRTRRDALERELETLRQNKERMLDAEYAQRLEAILIPLAQLYAQLDEAAP